MPAWKMHVCQRKPIACAITSLVVLVGLLIPAGAIYLVLSREGNPGETSTQDVTSGFIDSTFDDCRSKATVVTDKAMMRKWDTCRDNFSQAWSNAEQNMREPTHQYMDKRHSFALYMYTNTMLQSVQQNLKSEEQTGKQKETLELHSLYFTLSEAIQILKHSQVTCFSTNYRTETPLHLNISNKQVRFSTFTIGLNEWNFTRNGSCFEVYSCFGADVTHYSALKQQKQVLIPPYEVFKVTDIQTETQRCEMTYRLRSNLNCVYDRQSNMLHPISALPVEGFLFILVIVCILIITVFHLLLFDIVKVKETCDNSGPSFHNCKTVTL